MMYRKKEEKGKKKAVSLMLSYVLLIIIVLSVAVGVYIWWEKIASIEETPECPDGISLIIQDYVCDAISKTISITVKNKGLFNIEGYYIKGTDEIEGKAIFPLEDAVASGPVENGEYFFDIIAGESLKPNRINTYVFSYDVTGIEDLKKIEIVPFKVQDKYIILCSQARIEQEVECG